MVLTGTANAQPRTILDLDTRTQPVALADWGDYWIDTTARFTPEEVARTSAIPWKPTRTGAIYPLQPGYVMWVRIRVPPAPDAERWYLEVPSPSLDRASLYTLDSSERWSEQHAGDQIAVSTWPVPHRYALLPIKLSAEAPTQHLLRLENSHVVSAPLRFISEARLSHLDQKVSLILGIFFGLTGLAAAVSAMGAVSLRDPAYGWFSVWVMLLGLTQASLTGIGGLHLWPDTPLWNDLSKLALPILTIAVSLLFISYSVSMPERSNRRHRLMAGCTVVGTALAVAVTVVPPANRDDWFTGAVVALLLIGVISMVWATRRGDRYAPWLLLSYLPIIAAAGWILSRNVGMIRAGFLTQYGMHLAIAVHLPIVMLLLMMRSRQKRENFRRIQGLDRVDPATGLINGHVFAERLMRMIARSTRLRHNSALLLIDVVNSDQIHRDFGRKAAEDLPLRVAERLLSTAREIDSAARLSERRFGMLVEGPISAEDAATLGPRIVARCLMPFKGLHVDCVAQVRIAYALVPQCGTDAHALLTQLEERLLLEPANSRRAVLPFAATTKLAAAPKKKASGLIQA